MKGFLGQIGGWSKTHPMTACIYSFWESQEDYQRFMEEVHDQIIEESAQARTYNSINVNLFQEKLIIPGSEDNIVNILRNAAYVKISVSRVKKHRKKHFVEMQKKVWNIGMSKSKGMLGGTFALSKKENNKFLILTGWQNENYHQKYMEEHFQELLQTAKPKNDVLELNGEQFKVEEAWRVCPTNSN